MRCISNTHVLPMGTFDRFYIEILCIGAKR